MSEKLRPPPWPDQLLLTRALDLMARDEALRVPGGLPDMVAAQPTEAYREILDQLGPAVFKLRVQCRREHCRGSLGSWQLSTTKGIAVVWDRPSRPVDRTSNVRPFTSAANAGKGYRSGPNTHDGDGTYTTTCKKCRRAIPLSAPYRTKLFLQALKDHQDTILA